MLAAITALLDLTGLSVALWLAFYALARGFNNHLTRRAFIILILISLFFLGAYNNIYEQVPGSAAWRAVYLIAGLYFWFDLTCLLLPDDGYRRVRPLRTALLAFAATAAAVLLFVPGGFRGEVGNAFDIGQMAISIHFVLYGLYMVVIAAAMLYNHSRLHRAGLTHKYRYFFTATLLIAVNVVHGVLSLAVLPPQSRIVQDGLILSAIFVLGYSVARHQTFVERRTSFRDFQVSGLTILAFAIVFDLTGLGFGFSPQEIGVLVALSVFSLGSYDFIRVALETRRLEQTNLMREQIMATAHTDSADTSPGAAFTAGLTTLRDAMEAESAVLALLDGDGFRVAASTGAPPPGTLIPGTAVPKTFDSSSDLIETGTGVHAAPGWIAPSSWQGEILAVIGVGPRRNGGAYNEGDLDLLTEFAEQTALFLHLRRLQQTRSDYLASLTQEYQADRARLQTGGETIVEMIRQRPGKELVGQVEECLRSLSDYTRLGNSPLVDQLGIEGETHLVRGRALREKMLAQLDLLRPPGKRPSEPLPREWHTFAVVHDAYVENVPNREIMARLYISEGTFNRTRRNAIRAIARSVVESGMGS